MGLQIVAAVEVGTVVVAVVEQTAGAVEAAEGQTVAAVVEGQIVAAVEGQTVGAVAAVDVAVVGETVAVEETVHGRPVFVSAEQLAVRAVVAELAVVLAVAEEQG